MSINLEYYRTFYNVANLGSMGKAAEFMCLTPPTVTKTIQALEQQLGCLLFTRSAKGVRLTAAGEALFLRVKPGIHLLDAGEHEVNMLNSLEGGTVRLAAGVAAIHHFTMPAVLESFCTRYPKVKLAIKHLSTSAAMVVYCVYKPKFSFSQLPQRQDLLEPPSTGCPILSGKGFSCIKKDRRFIQNLRSFFCRFYLLQPNSQRFTPSIA